MTKDILDLNTINLTPDISSIKNDNLINLNNYSFEECKEIIKKSYIKNTNYNKCIDIFKLGWEKSEKFWFSLTIFSMFLNYFFSCLAYSYKIFGLFFFLNFSFTFFSIYILSKKDKKIIIRNEKLIKSNFINNIDYFLPLSKNELSIILKNNNNLQKYVQKYPNIIYSQYEIDKVLGTSSNNDFFEEGKEINDTFLNVSSVEFMNIKDTINNEQKDAIFVDYDCNVDNQYKVVYSIENGPDKEVIFNYTHCDENLFRKHICNIVESEYGRECEILSIDLVK